jgi:hypothetical protein
MYLGYVKLNVFTGDDGKYTIRAETDFSETESIRKILSDSLVLLGKDTPDETFSEEYDEEKVTVEKYNA